MSNEILQRTQRIGVREEVTEMIDPITDGDAVFYEFGIFYTTWGKFPIVESDIKQFFKGLQFNAYQTRVSGTQIVGSITFIPVTGLFFYYLLGRNGSGVSHTAGVFKIPGITSGFLNSYVVRFRSDNDQDRIQRSCLGIKFIVGRLSLDFDQPNDPLSGSLGYLGRRMDRIISGVTSLAALPQQPVSGATQNQRFLIDDNTEVRWDVTLDGNDRYDEGPSGLDLKPYMKNLTISVEVTTKPVKIQLQHYPAFIVNGFRVFTIQMKLRRTDETSIFEHYTGNTQPFSDATDDSQAGLDYRGLAAFKHMHFKIFAKDVAGNVDNYIQVDWKDVAIARLEMNNALPSEEAWYDITLIATSGLPETKDDVAPALYGTS